MTLIKRTLSKIQPGDVLIRKSTGERCKLLDIYHNTTQSPGRLVYRFWGFDVMRPAMRGMFDLIDDRIDDGLYGFVPYVAQSYVAIHGQAT